ncbi:hypothetical protein D3C79_766030 [compost metagenome]
MVHQALKALGPLGDIGAVEVKGLQVLPAAHVKCQLQRVLPQAQGLQPIEAGQGGAAFYGKGDLASAQAQIGQRGPAL